QVQQQQQQQQQPQTQQQTIIQAQPQTVTMHQIRQASPDTVLGQVSLQHPLHMQTIQQLSSLPSLSSPPPLVHLSTAGGQLLQIQPDQLGQLTHRIILQSNGQPILWHNNSKSFLT
ncbi:mediator of RNA polymerase II transcription subunit 15-like, partial [Ctenocephalides felis]|uniref:mediator of RNA polymerase II transcription subunit 15-like n=1 Tax=Ctenocephalides felis TaxID=7515 RepID=UPI000E6E41BC